jgi:GNAT superfamily N-acetyltransferase
MPNCSDDYQVDVSEGIVLIKNQNTTIGYCRFNESGEVEYIFVNPLYRRKGFGMLLINEVKRLKGPIEKVHDPISPLGAQFFKGIGLAEALRDDKKDSAKKTP